jgi:hypothetical protein
MRHTVLQRTPSIPPSEGLQFPMPSAPLIAALLAVTVGCSPKQSEPADASDDGSTDGSIEGGDGAIGFTMVAPDGDIDIGRYWARLRASGSTQDAATVWFEVKHPDVPEWNFVARTPERSVAGDTDDDAVEEWFYGLTAGVVYAARICARTGAEPGVTACSEPAALPTKAASAMRWVGIDPEDPKQLAFTDTGERFIVWGNNYVGVNETELNHATVEDQMYTPEGRALIDADLTNLRDLTPPDGRTNSVRMHLQLHEFLLDATTPHREAYARFAKIIEMAEDHGLYVMVTGLNYFYPADNPLWIAEQTEAEHWETQALWWNEMATALRASPGVFAYDLMNEPYCTSTVRIEDGIAQWTGAPPDSYCDYGEDPEAGIHGTCFGQHVCAAGNDDPGARAAEWTAKMRAAIRFTSVLPNDSKHLITVGAAGSFGLNNVFNGTPAVHALQDFLSPHLYPEVESTDEAVELAAALSEMSGKPLIAGETFPFGPVEDLIRRTCDAGTVQGWMGQYDGRKRADACPNPGPFGCLLFNAWYDLQRDLGPTFLAGNCPVPGTPP